MAKFPWYMKEKDNEIHFHWLWVLWQTIKIRYEILTTKRKKYSYMTQQTASALQIKLAAEDLIAKMQAAVPTFMRDGNKVHYYTANDRRQLAIQYAAIAAELMLSETDTNHAYQYNRWQDTLTYLQVVANETEG